MAAATVPFAGYGNQGPSPSPSKSVTPIARLNPYQNRWTIKARVMVKGDMRCAAMVLFLLVIHALVSHSALAVVAITADRSLML
jgi:hypothetical protein